MSLSAKLTLHINQHSLLERISPLHELWMLSMVKVLMTRYTKRYIILTLVRNLTNPCEW